MPPIIRITKENIEDITKRINNIVNIHLKLSRRGRWKAPNKEEDKRIFEKEHSDTLSVMFDNKILDLNCETICQGKNQINFNSSFYFQSVKIDQQKLINVLNEIEKYYHLPVSQYKVFNRK